MLIFDAPLVARLQIPLYIGSRRVRCRFIPWFHRACCHMTFALRMTNAQTLLKFVTYHVNVSVEISRLHMLASFSLLFSGETHWLGWSYTWTETAALTCCTGVCLGSKSGLRGTSSSGLQGSFLDSSSGRRPSSTAAERSKFNSRRLWKLQQDSNTSTNACVTLRLWTYQLQPCVGHQNLILLILNTDK